ncbi:MAG: DinB family protein, partial [Planctomycetes bacterium]|nr:DinB family protein [Planctomycetota bacterium]
MNAKDLLRYNVTFTHQITRKYLDDVTDEELLVRAVPGSNHLAWQLGHLVASERSLLEAIGPAVPGL